MGKVVLFTQQDLPVPSLLVSWGADGAGSILRGSCTGFLPSDPSLPWCEGDQVCHLCGEDRESLVSYLQKSG